MKKEINTDKLFSEKLKDFSESPPPHIWDNVQTSLVAQKRKRRMAYIGWISAAAVVLLAFVGGWYFNESRNGDVLSTNQTEVVQPENNRAFTEDSNLNTSALATSDNNENDTNEKEQIPRAIPTNKNHVAAAAIRTEGQIQTEEIPANRISNDLKRLEAVEVNFRETGNNNVLAQKTALYSSEELSETEKFILAENVRNMNKTAQQKSAWKMGMNISPGYSSQVASHSESYANSMSYSASSGNASISGGISVQYKTKKKWSFESGVYYAQNGQKSEPSFELFAMHENADALYSAPSDAYFSNEVKMNNGNLEMNANAGVIAFSGAPKGAEVSANFDAVRTEGTNSLITSGEFSQVFDFVEIPLFVRYRVVDSKFGVELMGGFNAGIVVGNDAYIDNEYGLQNVGKTEDISPVNVSGTLGLGVNYKLGEHFSLGVEPRFNYYLSSINNNPNVDFRPYRIGFYTGVYYQF